MVDIFQRPAEEPSTLQRIGAGLQGFGAGVGGRGEKFLAGQRQEERTLSNERLRAAAEDVRRGKLLVDAGDLQGLRNLLQERIGMITELGGDPRDTAAFLPLVESAIGGDRTAFDALQAQLGAAEQAAIDRGFLKPARQPLSPAGKLQSDIDRGFITQEQASSGFNSTKVVQSSKILPGGVVQITFKDGTISVEKASGEELRIVKDAEDRGVSLAQASSAARVVGKGVAGREQKVISAGVEAVQAIPILRRGLQLLERVETGGFSAASLRAKQLFGIEGADEGELSANLGRAVLSQLRETFGAAFTENEGARLERLSAGFGKSLASNKRLLRQALVLIQGSSDRGLKAAGRVGDEASIEQILDFQEGRFDLTDEALSDVFNPVETPAPSIIRFDAQGNRING